MVEVTIDQQDLLTRITLLRGRHEDIHHEVDALIENGVLDQLKFARLKKEKLRLKDEISLLEDQMTPDIIA
jgi:hypothetical protein